VVRSGNAPPHRMLTEHRTIVGIAEGRLSFKYVTPFRNWGQKPRPNFALFDLF